MKPNQQFEQPNAETPATSLPVPRSARLPRSGLLRRRRMNSFRRRPVSEGAAFSGVTASRGEIEPPSSPVFVSSDRSRSDLRQRPTTAIPSAVIEPGLRFADPPPPPQKSYTDWFRETVLRSRWLSWFATLYVHWIVILVLMLIIVHVPEAIQGFLIEASVSEPSDLIETTFDVAPVELTTSTELSSQPEPSLDQSALEATAADDTIHSPDARWSDAMIPDAVRALAKQSSAGGNPAEDPASSNVNPAPASAVTVGSFSVWTEPENPDPGEPYRIIIQIRVPDGTTRYDVTDMEGVVVGSDGYRKPIPGSVRGFLPVETGFARFVAPIVSADEDVADTIFIRSKALKESQKLLIQF